jgi:hypothetical protein
MRISLGKFVLLVSAGAAVCCGSDAKKTARTPPATAVKTGTPSASTEDTDLGVKPLAYGAYLTADLTPAGAEVGLEFGTIYMRKQHYVGEGELFDYIWVQATAFGTSGFLPQKAATGCAVPQEKAPAASQATAAVLSGSLTDTLPAAGTLYQLQDVAGAKIVDHNSLVTANVNLASGQVAVKSLALPSSDSYIRFSGAYDLNLTTSMPIADLNSNLGGAKNDLKISFTKKTDKENLAIVTFYGGQAASTKVYRCFIQPNGNVVIPASVYKGLLPVRGLTGVFANVEAKTEGGNTTWSSTINGSGIVDQAVP